MRFCELKEKEVINLKDCKRLGYVSDLEIEICTGCIKQIIVPGPGKCYGIFGKGEEFIIGFNQIKQIGPDIILVDLNCGK